MYRVRDREYSWLLGDSGIQIGKGKWEGDWRANSGCPKHRKNVMVYYVGWMLIWTME